MTSNVVNSAIAQAERAADLDNWAGPFTSLQKAVDYAEVTWGVAEGSRVWRHNARKIYINDNIDPDTGKPWKSPPKGSYVYP